MKKTNKYDTFCPLFPGFYGTLFEYDGEDQDIENYNEEHKTAFDWDDFTFDYADHRNRIAKAFVNRLETKLNHIFPVKIHFQELYSPREYNFSNDSINVSIELNLDVLLTHIKANKEAAREYFKNKYTSCSGFISFHSPDVDMWLNKSYILQDSKHRVGALLDCLCNIQTDFECTDEETYYWVDSENWIDFTPKEQLQPATIKANAKLIASAPVLFEENKRLKEQVKVLQITLQLIYKEGGFKADSHIGKRINAALSQTETK